jgi:hypothetical protein
MSALLGVDARDLTVHRNPSERVATVTVTTPGGATELAGTTLRTKLGLRSTWFTLGLLSLSPAQTTITYGDDDPLAYRTHDLGTVALERKRYRQPWARVQDLPAAAGTITGHPVIKTAYRLTSSEGTGASILVQVRPRLTLRRTATGLAGTVRPTSLAGTGAALQKRRSDGVWVTVARATVGRTGAFSARLRVTRGAYRARLVPAATSGFVTGTSATLTV